ncbi:MAG: HepT-like ribonuclease domain-containing protein [Bacteroidota bacterium]
MPPEQYPNVGLTGRSCIRSTRNIGIISKRPEYENMVRFRNFIVHRYEKIDLEIIYEILKNKLFLFREFRILNSKLIIHPS